MPVLVFLVPLAVLFIVAVVYYQRRSRRLGAFSSHDVNSGVHQGPGDARDQLPRGWTGGSGSVGGP